MPYDSIREPSCIHDNKQPASKCKECKDSVELAQWKAYWHGRRDEYNGVKSQK
jgi:hypothetical protein